MPWIVSRKFPYSPIEATEVAASLTSGEVDALVGTNFWVAMDAVSARDAIDAAIQGGFTNPPHTVGITPLPESEKITVGQLLAAKKAAQEYFDK